MVHVRRQHQGPARRSTTESHDDVSETIAPVIQPVFRADDFDHGTHARFVERRRRTRHQPLREADKFPRIHAGTFDIHRAPFNTELGGGILQGATQVLECGDLSPL
jgi:hypothetical protein